MFQYLLKIFSNIDNPQNELLESHDIFDQRLSFKLDFLLHVFLLLWIQCPDERSYLNLTNKEIILSYIRNILSLIQQRYRIPNEPHLQQDFWTVSFRTARQLFILKRIPFLHAIINREQRYSHFSQELDFVVGIFVKYSHFKNRIDIFDVARIDR